MQGEQDMPFVHQNWCSYDCQTARLGIVNRRFRVLKRPYRVLSKDCKKPWLYGLKYDEITEGLRGYRANKHIIFYQILHDDEILIIRILHQQMDLKRRMIED